MSNRENKVKSRTSKQLKYDTFKKGKNDRIDSLINKTKNSNNTLNDKEVSQINIENNKTIGKFYRGQKK